ncbi:MAG: chitosanase, partial [Saprospiraceae bacterium]
IVQVTYGRSQTTEFGHLKTLINDYVTKAGRQANIFQPYIGRVGKKPSLENDDIFCNALKEAGKNDPIMWACQDSFFDKHYYHPAHKWFKENEFTQPLSLLVIYDSFIHSGRIPPFLRERFEAVVPSKNGDEKEWIRQYVSARHDWLADHQSRLLRKTIYRTKCFTEEIASANWDLSLPVNAHGTTI